MDVRKTYERMSITGSGKKAMAVARRLALRVRRMLMEQKGYHYGDGSAPIYAKDKTREIRRYVLHPLRGQTA